MEAVNKQYYDNGKLSDELFYKDGKPILKRHYYENGVLSHEIPTLDVTNIHGIVRHYYETGQLAREQSFENGLKNGREYLFWVNGNVRYSTDWKNHNKHGIHREYNENGDLILYKRYIENEELPFLTTLSMIICDWIKNTKVGFNTKKHSL